MIAFNDDVNQVSVATGDLATTTFTVTQLPPPSDGGSVGNAFPSAAAASDGSLGVAYTVTTAAGGAGIVYLKVGTTTPVNVVDSGSLQNDRPLAALSFAGSNPVVGVTLCLTANEDDACTLVSVSSDGGTTFGTAVPVPADKGTGPAFNMAVAADDQGDAAISYNPNSSNGSQICGNPQFGDSHDGGKTWQICGPSSPDPDRSLAFGAGPPALAVSSSRALVIAFQQSSDSSKAPTGVLVKVIG